MEKILTIVIPTYNMEKLLEKDLQTLVIDDKNLFQKVEILVVIDGAKDQSSEIAHRFQNAYPNTFRVIDKENGNYGSCVNRGIKEAKGKYISVLDADDYYDTKVFQEYIKYLETVDVDLVINNQCLIDEDDNVVFKSNFNLPEQDIFNLSVIPELTNLTIHTVAYRTENLRAIAYRQTEGISYTDQEWMLTPMITVHKVAYFKGCLYYYLWGREGQTMEEAVFVKNIDQNLNMLKSNMAAYERYYNSSSPDIQSYFDSRLRIRLNVVYELFLLKHNSLSIDKLIELDKYIRCNHPTIHSLADKITTPIGRIMPSGFFYIKEWRKRYSKFTYSYFIYNCVRFASKVKMAISLKLIR